MTKCTAGVGLRTCVFFRCCRSDSFLTGREILSHAEKLGVCLWIVWAQWWEKLTERRAKRTIKSNDTDCTRVRQWLTCFLLGLLEQIFSWVHLWDAAECVRLYTHQLILLHYRPSFPFPLADASVWYICSQWSVNKTEQKKKKKHWYWITMSTGDFKQMLRLW